MSYDQHHSPPQDKDPQLWQIAQKRASFKYHFISYLAIHTFFWIVWYLNGQGRTYQGWPWPVWSMLGWGIGLLFHWLGAYVFPKENSVEKEYEKLKKKQNQ